jgi:hypothetical protein
MINRKTSRDLAVSGARVLADAHLTWIAAEVESEHALRAWIEGARRSGAVAYAAYCTAIDREEEAARDLERLCELVRPHEQSLAFP